MGRVFIEKILQSSPKRICSYLDSFQKLAWKYHKSFHDIKIYNEISNIYHLRDYLSPVFGVLTNALCKQFNAMTYSRLSSWDYDNYINIVLSFSGISTLPIFSWRFKTVAGGSIFRACVYTHYIILVWSILGYMLSRCIMYYDTIAK